MKQNRILNEDCMLFMKSLPPCSIDLIIADPPYYQTKGEFDFKFESYQEYLAWCEDWIMECHRILKDGGVFYCYQQEINKIIDIGEIIKKCGFELLSDIIWYYATGRPQKYCFRKEHEIILYCSKGTPNTFNGDKVRIEYETKDKRHNPNGKSLGTVWRESRIKPNYKSYVGHPTQKPSLLSDRMILTSSNERDVIYIPFAGSGTEIVSCINNNRNWIATEINREYIDEIINPRINNLSMKGAMD